MWTPSDKTSRSAHARASVRGLKHILCPDPTSVHSCIKWPLLLQLPPCWNVWNVKFLEWICHLFHWVNWKMHFHEWRNRHNSYRIGIIVRKKIRKRRLFKKVQAFCKEKVLRYLLEVFLYDKSKNQCWQAEKWRLHYLISIFPRWPPNWTNI